MFNKSAIYEALRHCQDSNSMSSVTDNPDHIQASLISLLIHDIFGGEILKTHIQKGWHFYNRIEGDRVDFSNLHNDKAEGNIRFQDIPADAEELNNYVEKEEYSAFLQKFIREFEETVGLENYHPAEC